MPLPLPTSSDLSLLENRHKSGYTLNMDWAGFDAIVVGSGPNGLAAAIRLQQEGLSVLVLEKKGTIGGGMRSAELTLPGFVHDICSAIHPLAAGSPFLANLPLKDHGLHFIYPPVAAAHPFDDGKTAMLERSIHRTARTLLNDHDTYQQLFEPLIRDWPLIAEDVLGPLRFPKLPFHLASFGIKGLVSARKFANCFAEQNARGLWAGMAAHAMLPLSYAGTSAVALVLMIAGHIRGWPVIRGGSEMIAKAMASFFTSIGGKIQTNCEVFSLDQLPPARAVLLDITPRQLLKIAGDKLSSLYKWQLKRYQYGMGVFKIDWALAGPIPWKSSSCQRAGTVHLGSTFEEIASAEWETAKGKHPDRPFVLLAQQSLFDSSRAPSGRHTAWGYCHVPHGSVKNMTAAIESQVERFAPGFKDLILARHCTNSRQLESYNPNYIGGDINGGENNIRQLFTRPVIRLSPYRTSNRGLYLCSSSTPPGGGVHGMCGFHAATQVLKDIFHMAPKKHFTFARSFF